MEQLRYIQERFWSDEQIPKTAHSLRDQALNLIETKYKPTPPQLEEIRIFLDDECKKHIDLCFKHRQEQMALRKRAFIAYMHRDHETHNKSIQALEKFRVSRPLLLSNIVREVEKTYLTEEQVKTAKQISTDPWETIVRQYCLRYGFDHSQENTAYSILRELISLRDSEKPNPKRYARLMDELRHRLDAIPTVAQRASVPTAATSRPYPSSATTRPHSG